MKIETTTFKDLLIIHPRVYEDERGFFFEPFSEARFRIETGLNYTFVQDNESMSHKHVLRGMHFQVPPKAMAKLIRVSLGSVLDVVVDLRKSQPTYGQHFKIKLDAESKTQLFVPEGFAHGFLVLEDNTIFTYKCSNYYAPEYERILLWNDPLVGIDWQAKNPVLSKKDLEGSSLGNLDADFF
ncbi:MAG: dTDP-4-dehydrorhamnose 3,5-epimerase [Flavobacteriales bacterium]